MSTRYLIFQKQNQKQTIDGSRPESGRVFGKSGTRADSGRLFFIFIFFSKVGPARAGSKKIFFKKKKLGPSRPESARVGPTRVSSPPPPGVAVTWGRDNFLNSKASPISTVRLKSEREGVFWGGGPRVSFNCDTLRPLQAKLLRPKKFKKIQKKVTVTPAPPPSKIFSKKKKKPKKIRLGPTRADFFLSRADFFRLGPTRADSEKKIFEKKNNEKWSARVGPTTIYGKLRR